MFWMRDARASSSSAAAARGRGSRRRSAGRWSVTWFARPRVLAGVMLPATGPAVEAARQAADFGADAIVVGSPYYFGIDPLAQRRHIEPMLAAVTVVRRHAAALAR